MKKRYEFHIFVTFCFLTLFIPGCVIVRPPSVTTALISNIGPTSATAGGNVTNDGNSDILVRGVCWSTKKSPDVEDPRTTDGYGEGVFVSNITGLKPNTLYYVRAYATNSEGISYGNQVTFTTSQFSTPLLTTSSVTGITETTAVTGGNITFDGGVSVTARGVCWSSTKTVPDIISDPKTSNGTGSGVYTSNITGLTGNTQYYVRAYATNSQGTGYGEVRSFTTNSLLPTVITAEPSATSSTTGAGGGTVTNDGGSAVTARGVCWSTASNPTISHSRTNDGGGTGIFTSTITSLSANTTYHVRAYATNSNGTNYGADIAFTTDPVSVSDNDGNSYDVIRIGSQVWMAENLKTTQLNDGSDIELAENATEWGNLTSVGYCWYSNNISYKNVYGALYNWYAVSSGKLCPVGWRVSTNDDWEILTNYLGGYSPAGGKLKETGTAHWNSPNTGATNEYDFTALPGGWRTNTGTFQYIRSIGYWWTSTIGSPPDVYYRHIQNDNDKVFMYYKNEKYGMSVRCVKN
jgi:uncharacterized protein (TIGR02145 family)